MEPYRDEYYYEASEQQIRELWLSLENKPISLYLNNPFCATICQYCAYKGTPYTKKNYDEFYGNILPKRLQLFNETIKNNKPHALFMGGGTPNLLSPDDLDRLLNSIEKLDDFKLKVFEAHPALYRPEHLDVLQKHSFDIIMLGVQTFDKETLRSQNRLPHSFEKVQAIIEEANAGGLTTAVDIIAFLNQSDFDYQQIAADIVKVSECDPDWIAVYNNYYNKSTESVSKLINVLVEFANRSHFDFELQLEKGELIRYMKAHRCIRLVNHSGKEKTLEQMSIVTEMLHDTSFHQNYGTPEYYLMGIGNWKYTIYNNTFSVYFTNDRQVEYIEVRDGSNTRYFVTYDTLSKTPRDEFLKALFDMLPPPDGRAKLSVNTKVRPVPGKIYRKSNVCFLTFSNASSYKSKLDVKSIEKLAEKHDVRVEIRFE